jgi:hypothetical protein
MACVQGQLPVELQQWEGMLYEACAFNVCRQKGIMLPEMLAYIAKQLEIRLFVLESKGGYVQATGFGDPGTLASARTQDHLSTGSCRKHCATVCSNRQSVGFADMVRFLHFCCQP